MSVPEHVESVMAGKAMSQDGLRCRGSVSSGGSTPYKEISSTPVTCKVGSKLEFPGCSEDEDLVSPLTGKHHRGLQSHNIVEDSGFHDHEISLGDSPRADLKQPNLTTSSIHNDKITSLTSGEDITVAKNESKASMSDREDWNVHLLSTLILIVVLGACGFSLLLTLRHLKDGEEQWSENGKYLSIKFARESIEEQARLQEIVESIEEGLEYNSPLDAAGPRVEVLLDSVDYPENPNFRILENEGEDSFIRVKRDLVGEEEEGARSGDGFRFRVARHIQEELGDKDGEFRFRKYHQVESAEE